MSTIIAQVKAIPCPEILNLLVKMYVCLALDVIVCVPPVIVLNHGFEVPARGKRTESLTEALIINSTSVDGEQTHQKDQIPPTKHHAPNLKEKHKCKTLK